MIQNSKYGFTLIEIVVATAVFLVFAVGAYRGFVAVYSTITATRLNALAADLVNAQFELIKNMPYNNVGTVGGNPTGIIVPVQTALRDGISFTITTTVLNVDDPFDGTAGGDPFPRDYKLVEISITCPSCRNLAPVVITGRIAPKNLESALRESHKHLG
jgi:prepilin-type N-terminal cleavage/methylation domain-containing protein